jgi:hypothetical protein
VKRDGKQVGEIDMEYAGKVSRFRGTVAVNEPGIYEVTVYAYDPVNGNTGLDRTSFMVSE